MDQQSLEIGLVDLHLPAIRFFQSIGSTNDEALNWIEAGASHLSLVIANGQTAGRGRSQRRWFSSPGASLAFSLILRSPPFDVQLFSRLSGLGALAVRDAILKSYALPVQIKWPNDILIDQKKAGGVLVETTWHGDNLQGIVIGIGINIAPESISPDNLPAEGLNFPVTCIQSVLGHPVDRVELLHAVLQELLTWLPRLSLPEFILEWGACLAFRHQWVEITGEASQQAASPMGSNLTAPRVVKVIGLTQDGSLQILTQAGRMAVVKIGEIHLHHSSIGLTHQPLD